MSFHSSINWFISLWPFGCPQQAAPFRPVCWVAVACSISWIKIHSIAQPTFNKLSFLSFNNNQLNSFFIQLELLCLSFDLMERSVVCLAARLQAAITKHQQPKNSRILWVDGWAAAKRQPKQHKSTHSINWNSLLCFCFAFSSAPSTKKVNKSTFF